MLNNIFSKKISSSKNYDFAVATEQSTLNDYSETGIYEFMMLQEACMSSAVLENARHMYIGEVEDSVEIVQESAADFLDKVVEFFKKLIAKIKEWFGKIFLLIQTLLGNTGKMLEQNKGAFLKKNVTFDIQGFKYTIKDGAPKMEKINKLVEEYNKDISNVKENIKSSEISEKREVFKSQLSKYRGEILTSNENIQAEDFKEECDAFFRDGETDSITITVDRAYIEQIVAEYNNVKKTYDQAVKEKRNLEVQLESLKKFFENGARRVKYDGNGEKVITTNEIELKETHVKKKDDGTNHTATTSNLKLLNTYYNFRYEQSKELSNMVLTVLESKVRALKEQVKQYDTCVRRWITAPVNVEPKEKGDKNNG